MSLDCIAMAARISDIMGVLFRWYVAGTQLTVTPLAIGSFEEMSALPPVVGSDPPSSSSAVVPVQPAVGEQRIADVAGVVWQRSSDQPLIPSSIVNLRCPGE